MTTPPGTFLDTKHRSHILHAVRQIPANSLLVAQTSPWQTIYNTFFYQIIGCKTLRYRDALLSGQTYCVKRIIAALVIGIFSVVYAFAGLVASGNGTDTTMILIPGGWFMMGSENGEKDERPVHRVFIDPFFIGATEVTIGDYLACVRSGGCRMPGFWNRRFFGKEVTGIRDSGWFLLPVTGVSWDDAVDYCRWKGSDYRLPTEAEWEYAAGCGTNAEYPWGDDRTDITLHAVFGKRIKTVMSCQQNRFGVYDMIGNVWEWCSDRYDKRYYSRSPENNPEGPADTLKYRYRVVRGGAWNEYYWNIRTANRSYGEQFRRFCGVGFRICRNVKK